MSRVGQARSLLFVPGHRPDRFAKAEDTAADLVCIDLEDAVAPADRPAARRAVIDHLAGLPAGHRTGLRVSRLASADGLRDVLALAEAGADAGVRPAFVMLAKADSAEAVRLLAAHLAGTPLIALIESPRGVAAAAGIAAAHPQVQALMLGGVDLCVELGARFGWEALLHARGALVQAAAAAGIGCIDVPFLDVADAAGLAAETQRVAALGFSGKSCIHPQQVATVHAALAPAPAELEPAARVVQAAGAAGADAPAVLLDGRLVDRPVVLAAQRLLARAGR
jgi:citrate lyase subunit beta/citryl-CoA lyase/(S)-citramalyl-CoA lyase